jgi:hypothetical protein
MFTEKHKQPQVNVLNNILSQNLSSMGINWMPTLNYLNSLNLMKNLQVEEVPLNQPENELKGNTSYGNASAFMLRPTKIYDKFNIDDIDQIELTD